MYLYRLIKLVSRVFRLFVELTFRAKVTCKGRDVTIRLSDVAVSLVPRCCLPLLAKPGIKAVPPHTKYALRAPADPHGPLYSCADRVEGTGWGHVLSAFGSFIHAERALLQSLNSHGGLIYKGRRLLSDAVLLGFHIYQLAGLPRRYGGPNKQKGYLARCLHCVR